MNERLEHIKDWPSEARRGQYRVSQVAHRLGVSVRWIEMFFRVRYEKSPHVIFAHWREQEIRRLAMTGKQGKEIMVAVGFSHRSSLARSLSRGGGQGLRELRRESVTPLRPAAHRKRARSDFAKS